MTSESIYEHLFALTTIMKQRVVDNFDGDTLNERWATRDITGTGTFAMLDEVDGGFRITTGVNTSDSSSIWFNSIDHYDHNASVVIWVSRRATIGFTAAGLSNNKFDTSSHATNIQDDTGDTNKEFITVDASAATSTSTGVAIDTIFTGYKIICGASTYTAFVNGIQRATNSTNLPNAGMSPHVNVFARGAGSRIVDIRYYEAFNT